MLVLAITASFASCNSSNEDYWTEYAEWRDANNAWIEAQAALKTADGKDFYTKIVPTWNSQAYVLMHYYNDTMLTKDNLKPLSSSTCDVKYHGKLYNDVAFDSSYLSTAPADSVYRSYLPNMVAGWSIALQKMHIGDSCQIIIPYSYGYGDRSMGTIKPYSHLVFNIKLVDIPGYEKKP